MSEQTVRVKVCKYFRNRGVKVLVDQELDMPADEAADLIALGYVAAVIEEKPRQRAYKRRDLQAEE